MIFIDKIESPFKYVILVPGLILSEHSISVEARLARKVAIEEGFEDAVVVKHEDGKWKMAC